MDEKNDRLKFHALSKVRDAQGLPEEKWAKYHRPDNVSVPYTMAADELVAEGALVKTEEHGYRPGPSFEEALKKYGVAE